MISSLELFSFQFFLQHLLVKFLKIAICHNIFYEIYSLILFIVLTWLLRIHRHIFVEVLLYCLNPLKRDRIIILQTMA